LCTLQWPAHKRTFARRISSAERPPESRFGFQSAVSAGPGAPIATSTPVVEPWRFAVLRPRCWSGRKRILISSPCARGLVPPASAHSKTRDAFELV
jgi:hypothetical protein